VVGLQPLFMPVVVFSTLSNCQNLWMRDLD
jgi:hypothetical protein